MTTRGPAIEMIDIAGDDLTVLPDATPWDGRVFDAVLFDLDGTLVASGRAVVRSWATWAAENDIAPERLHGFHGMPVAQILAELVSGEQVLAAAERLEQL